MNRWSDVRIGDVVTALGRYRPVVVTVAAILLIVAFAPGPRYARPEPVDTAFEERPISPVSNTPGGASPPTTAPAAPGVSPGAGDFSGGGASFDSSFGGGSSPSFDSGSSFAGDESTAAPETSFEPTPPALVGADPGDGSALAVVGSGWASVTAATPIGGEGVPQGSLPVGKRFGQDDKRSFVRLAGQGTVLLLDEDPDGARGPIGTGAVVVRACKITSDWDEGGGQTFDAVTYDETTCVDGLRSGTTWEFDLGSFGAAERVDSRGFALVPGGTDADIDYQVAFTV